MNKFTVVLMVLMLVFVAAGSMVPNQALATHDGDVLVLPDDGPFCDEPIMEQNGGANDGSSGDPDGAGDGFGFFDDSFLDPLFDSGDGGKITIEEWMCILMEQIFPVQ